MNLDDQVGQAIAAFSPRSLSPEVAAFSRTVVARIDGINSSRAKALLFTAARLAGFAHSIGLELEANIVLGSSVIERFAHSPFAGDAATRRTLRTNARFLARHCGAPALPVAVPLSRERAKSPYTPSEIAGFLALADAQPTALRRARATALICLGAGAGLCGGDLRHVRGTDVIARSGGLLVEVPGRARRAVPVLGEYHRRLLASASFFGPGYLVSGQNPDSHNVTNPLIRSLSGGIDLCRLEPARLRSTWLCAAAEAIGLRAFMDAAGIVCSQRLGDLVARIEPSDEETMVALLGGS